MSPTATTQMKPAISVCIPVYNAAHYIRDCVHSVLAQTFQDFEIVLVNDGSTDNSLKVCQSLVEESPKISLYSTNNQGDTRTRGVAAAHASGTWVTFVDSDDTLPVTALADLFEGCSEKTDIVVGCHYETQAPAQYIPIQHWRELLVRSDDVYCSPVARLFRRDILLDEVFSLKTSIRAGTDMPMNIKIAFQTDKDIFLINKKVYNYYEHPDSLSHSAIWSIKKISDLYEEIVDSIPINKREEYMPILIQNRIMSLRKRYLLDNWRSEPINNTPYVLQLRRDIHETGYKLTVLQRIYVYNTDSVLAASVSTFKHKLGMAKRRLVHFFKESIHFV